MTRKMIVPNGWPCRLGEAPTGMFVALDYPDLVCFKTEYCKHDGRVEAYNSAGEVFYGDGNNHMVQPVKIEIEDIEELPTRAREKWCDYCYSNVGNRNSVRVSRGLSNCYEL